MSYQDILEKLKKLNGRELEDFFDKIQDWALLHGIGLRSKKNFDKNSIVAAPFTLLPSPIKEENFKKVQKIQPILNSLCHKLAYDNDFLNEALSNTIQHDEFTRRLFDIYKTVKEEGFSQTISLGLLRSDYLADAFGGFKQVELNTIASSMSGVINQVGILHRFVLEELGFHDHIKKLPSNSAKTKLCGGIIEAWNLYGQRSSVVMFLVEEVTYNIADQRFMEFEIPKLNPAVKVIRRSFIELTKSASLGPENQLIVDGLEIGVVYMRSGYDPAQYINEDCWSMRLLIERSRAVKCPSIQYHLVGTKKVQQVLSEPGVLEKFITDPKDLQLVREMFVDIYPLDQSPEGEEGYRLATSEPEAFVLKPQREGGGHNIYGSDIPQFLKDISRKEASAYILMRLIKPKPTWNILVRPDSRYEAEIVSELGIYGIIIGNEKEIFLNETGGHMLRSKEESTKEAGVNAGFGALDSPYLI